MNLMSIRTELETYSDEQLFEVISLERDDHNKARIRIAEKVLIERGYKIGDEEFGANHLQLSNDNIIFSRPANDTLDVSERINDLVEGIEQDELDIGYSLEKKYQDQDDNDFLQEYLNAIDTVCENRKFGERLEISSIENYERLLNTLQKKNLEVPETHQKKNMYVMNLMYTKLAKKNQRKGIFKIITGLLLILIPVVLVFAGVFRFALIIILVYGIIRVSKGISLTNQANDLKRKIRY